NTEKPPIEEALHNVNSNNTEKPPIEEALQNVNSNNIEKTPIEDPLPNVNANRSDNTKDDSDEPYLIHTTVEHSSPPLEIPNISKLQKISVLRLSQNVGE